MSHTSHRRRRARMQSGASFALALLVQLHSASPARAVQVSKPSAAPNAAAVQQASGLAPLAFSGLSLRQAQDDAVAQSPDVAVARAKATAAASSLAAARAGLGPSLVAGYALNPQAGTTPTSTVTQTAFNLGVQATLLSLTQYLPLLSQAEAAERGARADEVAAERNERIHASGLYFAALKARAALAARMEALALAEAQAQAAQTRFKAGDAPRIDVVRAAVAAAQALAASENAKAADANAVEALSLETGVAVAAISEPVAGSLLAVPVAATTVELAVQKAISQRAEVTSARENVASASAGLGAARAGTLPAITVSAGYEHGTDTGQPIRGQVEGRSPAAQLAQRFPMYG